MFGRFVRLDPSQGPIPHPFLLLAPAGPGGPGRAAGVPQRPSAWGKAGPRTEGWAEGPGRPTQGPWEGRAGISRAAPLELGATGRVAQRGVGPPGPADSPALGTRAAAGPAGSPPGPVGCRALEQQGRRRLPLDRPGAGAWWHLRAGPAVLPPDRTVAGQSQKEDAQQGQAQKGARPLFSARTTAFQRLYMHATCFSAVSCFSAVHRARVR